MYQRENHRNSRRRCPGCGKTFVGVSFGGVKIVNGKLCVDCEVEERVAKATEKILNKKEDQ